MRKFSSRKVTSLCLFLVCSWKQELYLKKIKKDTQIRYLSLSLSFFFYLISLQLARALSQSMISGKCSNDTQTQGTWIASFTGSPCILVKPAHFQRQTSWGDFLLSSWHAPDVGNWKDMYFLLCRPPKDCCLCLQNALQNNTEILHVTLVLFCKKRCWMMEKKTLSFS